MYFNFTVYLSTNVPQYTKSHMIAYKMTCLRYNTIWYFTFILHNLLVVDYNNFSHHLQEIYMESVSSSICCAKPIYHWLEYLAHKLIESNLQIDIQMVKSENGRVLSALK